jgi:hypothetical protein
VRTVVNSILMGRGILTEANKANEDLARDKKTERGSIGRRIREVGSVSLKPLTCARETQAKKGERRPMNREDAKSRRQYYVLPVFVPSLFVSFFLVISRLANSVSSGAPGLGRRPRGRFLDGSEARMTGSPSNDPRPPQESSASGSVPAASAESSG